MESTKAHWTENSLEDYLYRIGADFVFQLENSIGSQKDLAQSLKVTKGAVSQKLNNPGNLKLKTMIKYARALGLKLGVVLYNDDDPENKCGPVNADIFRLCWENAGKPRDFWQATMEWTEGASKNHEAMIHISSGYDPFNRGTFRYHWNEIGETNYHRKPTAGNTEASVSLEKVAQHG